VTAYRTSQCHDLTSFKFSVQLSFHALRRPWLI